MAKGSSKSGMLDASMRAVILHGKESFLVQQRTAELRNALREAHGDFQEFIFDGETTTLADVLDELRSYGLLQEHKLVILDNTDSFLKQEGYRKAMEAYVQSPVEEATLLMRAETWRAGNLDKYVAKVGMKIECKPPKDAGAISWCVAECPRRHGCAIARDAAVLLVDRIGTTLTRLDSELGKLAAYVGAEKPITRGDVVELVGATREEQAWILQSAIITGKPERALQTLRDLLEVSRVPEQLATWCIGDLTKRLHAASQMLRRGAGPGTVGKHLRLWGAEGDRLLDVARRGEPQRFARLMKAAADIDRGSKSSLGRSDRNLERLTLLVTDSIRRI